MQKQLNIFKSINISANTDRFFSVYLNIKYSNIASIYECVYIFHGGPSGFGAGDTADGIFATDYMPRGRNRVKRTH